MDELTLAEWLFIGEYAKDWKGPAAARRAGYEGRFAGKYAADVMARPGVAAEIAKIRDSVKVQIQLSTNMVAQDILNVLTADARDLYEIHQDACRYCHGRGHQYQRTMNEYARDEFAANATKKPFNEMGGQGFNPTMDPHPDCPECFGLGVTTERIKDTRFLPPDAVAMYMGGKRGKNGLEVFMRSKDAAREAAARFLGMNKETLQVIDGKNLKEASDEDLEAIARGEKR